MRFQILIYFVLGVHGYLAQASWRDISAKDFILPPPPLKNSIKDQDDMFAVLWNQFMREPKDCKFGNDHLEVSYRALYSGFLTEAEVQHSEALLNDVMTLVVPLVGELKQRYLRPRPFQSNQWVEPCIPRESVDDTSYPSGHALFGAVSACVLAEIFPGRSESILKYGEYLGDYRVIVGVHYPSDVLMGKKIGRDLCRRLLQDSDFRGLVTNLRGW